MTDKWVCFDFEAVFSNGGGLQGQDFRLDIKGDDIDDDALAAYIIRDMRLLMVGEARILNKRIIEERHKRDAPANKAAEASAESTEDAAAAAAIIKRLKFSLWHVSARLRAAADIATVTGALNDRWPPCRPPVIIEVSAVQVRGYSQARCDYYHILSVRSRR